MISQFCSHVREYAYLLGKKDFFLFGEFVGAEEMYNRYIGPKTSVMVEDKAIYFGLNSVLDFPLYHIWLMWFGEYRGRRGLSSGMSR